MPITALLRHFSRTPSFVSAPPPSWEKFLESIDDNSDFATAFQADYSAFINALDDKGFTPLHAAATLGRLNAITWLLVHGADIEARTKEQGSTPLHAAASKGQLKAAVLLLDNGANIEAVNTLGYSPIYFATSHDSEETIKLLVERGANIEAQSTNKKQTPLHYAVRHKKNSAIQILIKLGANVNATDADGNTPLHITSRCNTKDIAQILLTAGADLTLQNKEGLYPLHTAAKFADPRFIDLLISYGADMHAESYNGDLPLFTAAIHSRTDNVRLFLDRGADKNSKNSLGSTLLHFVSIQKDAELLELLLSSGVSPLKKNGDGYCPIHIAAQHAPSRAIQLLLEYGADVHARAKNGSPPIHFAAVTGRIKNIKFLLTKGAKIDAVNNFGYSAISIAAIKGNVELTQLLLDYHASTEIRTEKGRTPLHIATEREGLLVMEALVTRGANLEAQDDKGHTPLHIAVSHQHYQAALILINNGSNLAAKNEEGFTPLHFAVDTKNSPLVQLLITKKVDVNISDKKGRTPLHLAAFLGEGPITHTLIQAGSDINAADENGNTPLHLAASRKHLETAITLLSFDTIDRERKNNDGKTPLCMAAAAGDFEMFTLLRSNGASTEAEHLPHVACEGGNLDLIEAIFDKDRFQKTDSAGKTPLMIALLHHSSQVVQFLDAQGIGLPFSEEDIDPSKRKDFEKIKLWDRWHDFEKAKLWEIDPSHLSWKIPIPAKPDSDLLTTWKNTLKALESDKPSPLPLTNEGHPWYGLNRIVTYTAKRMHEGIASIPSDPVEKKRFFDKIEGVLHYIFTADHSRVNLSIYCRQLDDSGRACGENWLHHTRQVYIQAARDLGDLPDPPSKENIERLFSDEAVQTALVTEAITLLLAAHDLQQRAFEREVIRYAGSRTPSDAHTIGLCARAFGDLFPLLDHQALPTDRVTTAAELLQLRKYRDEVKARLHESYSPCDIFWLAREHILLKNRDSDESEVVGWEYWDKAQSGGTIDEDRRSKLSGLLNSETLAEFLAFLGMITPKQNTCATS